MDAKTVANAAKKMRRRMGLPPAPAAKPIETLIEERAERVRDLVKANHGSIVFRTGNKVVVEIPADIAPTVPWAGQFTPIYIGQRTGQAERRVVSMQGQFVTCADDLVTQNFFRFEVDLQPR